MNTDLKFDPIFQIESVIEETRRNIDATYSSNKTAYMILGFYKIKKQLENYVETFTRNLAANDICSDDKKYAEFALTFHKQQLNFVNAGLETIMDTEEGVFGKTEIFREKYVAIHGKIRPLDEKYTKFKNKKSSLLVQMNSELDIIRGQQACSSSIDTAT